MEQPRFTCVLEIKRQGSLNGKGGYETIERLFVPTANLQDVKQHKEEQLKLF